MTKGAQKLAVEPGTQQEKASRLGVSQSTISSWLVKGVIPNGEQLIKLQQEYGIPVTDWLEEASEPAA